MADLHTFCGRLLLGIKLQGVPRGENGYLHRVQHQGAWRIFLFRCWACDASKSRLRQLGPVWRRGANCSGYGHDWPFFFKWRVCVGSVYVNLLRIMHETNMSIIHIIILIKGSWKL